MLMAQARSIYFHFKFSIYCLSEVVNNLNKYLIGANLSFRKRACAVVL